MKADDQRNVIERRAKRFADSYNYDHGEQTTTDNYQTYLRSAMFEFSHEGDKLIFLNKVREKANEFLSNHKLKCKKPDCAQDPFYTDQMFFVEQEINEINPVAETMSHDERIEFESKVDEVLGKLNELQLGQEIIFNEIDELKNLPHLKRKTLKEVIKGKLFDIAASKVVDMDTVQWIYEKLLSDDFPKLLK